MTYYQPPTQTEHLLHDQTRDQGYPTIKSDANVTKELETLVQHRTFQNCRQLRTASLRPSLLNVELDSIWYLTEWEIDQCAKAKKSNGIVYMNHIGELYHQLDTNWRPTRPDILDSQLKIVIRDFKDPAKTIVITSIQYEDCEGNKIYHLSDYYVLTQSPILQYKKNTPCDNLKLTRFNLSHPLTWTLITPIWSLDDCNVYINNLPTFLQLLLNYQDYQQQVISGNNLYNDPTNDANKLSWSDLVEYKHITHDFRNHQRTKKTYFTNREVFSYKAAKSHGSHLILTTEGLLHAPTKQELKFTSPHMDDITNNLAPNKEPTLYIKCHGGQRSLAIKLDIHRPQLVTHKWFPEEELLDQFDYAPLINYGTTIKRFNDRWHPLLHWINREIDENKTKYSPTILSLM